MKWLLGLVGVCALALSGCTGSNAFSCTDGTCSDPQKAYCDVDGTISGTPGLCIHVDCTPGEFVSCHGGKALVCNLQGNSYESNACLNGECDDAAGGCVACNSSDDCSGSLPACDTATHECVGCLASNDCPGARPVCRVATNECVGCLSSTDCGGANPACQLSTNTCVGCLSSTDCGGAKPVCQVSTTTCVGCLASSDCSGTKPVCDQPTLACRACASNGECSSDLCDVGTGACVDAASIIYVSPQGQTGTCGTMANPCSLTAGFTKLDATHKIIKMAVGAYQANNLTLNSGQAEIYGEGSTITSTAGSVFKVTGTSTLTIVGLKIVHSTVAIVPAETVIEVQGNGPAATFVNLRGVQIETNTHYFVGNYSLTLDRSSLKMVAVNVSGDQVYFGMVANGRLTARRSRFDHVMFRLSASSIHITNSLLVNNSAITLTDSNGGVSDISFSTFIDSPLNQTLPPTGAGAVVLNSTLHFGVGTTGATSQVIGNAFVAHYALMNPQAAAPANSDHLLLNVSPSFVNAGAGDYHLMAGSPAIDTADPAAPLLDDYDGNKRPVGAARDLGAFERQ